MSNPQLKSPREAIPFIADLFKKNRLVEWSMIVRAVSSEYTVSNWMTVRAALQAMSDAGLIKRTDNIQKEEYTLKSIRK